MKKASKIILFARVIGFSASALAFGGGQDHHKRGGNPQDRLEHMTVMLDLTNSQVEQLKPIFEKQMEGRKSKGGERRAIMKELHQAINNGANAEEINSIADRAADQARSKVLKRAGVMQAVQDILTEEQKVKAGKLRALRMQKHAKLEM